VEVIDGSLLENSSKKMVITQFLRQSSAGPIYILDRKES